MAAAETQGEHPPIEQQIAKPEQAAQIQEQEVSVKHVLQKVERDHATQAPVTDGSGQVVLTPSQPQQQQIVTLPLTEEEIKHGLHHKIIDSIRWLAEWCVRMGKKAIILGVRVVYPKRS